MKSKKSIYILLPLVLFIWGTVMYQVFSFSANEEEVIVPTNEISLKPIKISKRDSVVINTNYRDPFLGKIYSTEKVKTPKKKAAPKKVEPLVWPMIQYKGIVSDTKDKVKIYMLVINNRTCLMKKGETQNEIFLKDGDRESVYVKYKGQLNLFLIE
ncbi:hypothetical protein [Flavobacterium sp. GSA192]|uniref:hypothetical protein n=1 Tax=Flavobacterium sp. GSA192 TaxID=2576304 RepID=UPI00112B6FFA|nr:hypothetical protein [Flavobacterium sp. GSA192]